MSEFRHPVATFNSTWGELMYRLKGYVEGKNPGPLWREWRLRSARYHR